MNMALSHAPIILTARQERFVQSILGGSTATAAYRDAYGGTDRGAEANGSRMMRNDKVVRRIAQLRADRAAAAKIDLPYLTGLLTAAYQLGLQTKQSSAATQAAMGIAKLHGFVVDRALVDTVIRKPTLDPTSPDEMSEGSWLALTLGSTVEGSSPEGSEPRDSIDQDQPSTDQVEPQVVPGGA